MNKLKQYRQKTGLSQHGFAKTLGWWQSRIGNYEAGIRTPLRHDAYTIVNKLNELGVKCTINEVFPPAVV